MKNQYQYRKETGYYKKYYTKYRTLILDYYGNVCANCKIGYMTLCIDHVYNDGENDRIPGGSAGHGYYKKLWTQIEQGRSDRFQLLCHMCHRQKHKQVI